MRINFEFISERQTNDTATMHQNIELRLCSKVFAFYYTASLSNSHIFVREKTEDKQRQLNVSLVIVDESPESGAPLFFSVSEVLVWKRYSEKKIAQFFGKNENPLGSFLELPRSSEESSQKS